MLWLIKWLLRLVIAGVVAGTVLLILHRRTVIDRVENATEAVDSGLGAAEKKVDQARRKKEDLEEKGREAKERVF